MCIRDRARRSRCALRHRFEQALFTGCLELAGDGSGWGIMDLRRACHRRDGHLCALPKRFGQNNSLSKMRHVNLFPFNFRKQPLALGNDWDRLRKFLTVPHAIGRLPKANVREVENDLGFLRRNFSLLSRFHPLALGLGCDMRAGLCWLQDRRNSSIPALSRLVTQSVVVLQPISESALVELPKDSVWAPNFCSIRR